MAVNKFLGTVSVLAASVSLASPVFAQEAEDTASAPRDSVNEIVVTATRRDSNLQTTPVAVSAIDQTLIQQANVDNIGGLASFVPNFSAETITGFNAASFAMRGVGQNNIIVYFEPPVVVLVDDFVVPSVQTQLLDTFDVQQVEVLRGPQGTLFGKNSTGGAVTVRTKRPELQTIGVEGRLSYGSFGSVGVKAAANIPISDFAAFRFVGGYEKSDGYYKNGACYGPVTGFVPSKFDGVQGCLNGEDIGGKDVWQARAKLLIEPTSNITALFQYEWLRDRSGSVPSVNENQLYTGSSAFVTDLLGLKVPNPNSNDPLDNAGITLRNDAFLKDHQRINVDGLYANIDWSIDFGTFTSVTGWRKQTSRLPNSYPGVVAIAGDGQPLSIFDATRDDDRKTFQQELRFASDLGGPFDFVAGGFYQKDNTQFCVSQILGFLDLTNGPLPFGNWNDTPYILCNAQKAKTAALFAEGTFKVTDRLTITGGLRQTWDDKTWRGRQQAFVAELNGGFDPSITISQPLDANVYDYPANVVRVDAKSNELTYRVNIGYEATDDIYFYATHATGYKGGGFNDQIGGFAAFGADLDAFRAAARPTDPEKAKSYEVGVKSEFLDNRVRFNLTGFYVDYSNLQKQLNVPIVVNGAPNQVTIFVNAASATVKGLEAELTAKPVDNLTLRGVLGYQDGKYDSYDAPGAGYDLATAPLDRAPKWQWTIDATYEAPVANDYKLVVNGNVAHQGRNLYTQSIDEPEGNTYLNARTLLNASITVADVDDRYYVRLVGQNLTDERYRTASQNVAGLWLNSQYGAPRYFGVELGVNFSSSVR